MRGVAVGNKGKLSQFELIEPIPEISMIIDAMSIKLHSRSPDGYNNKQVASSFQNSLQFTCGFSIAHRIERIPVSTEPNVLHDMHARQ
nr:hypothetical protein [Cyanobium sp. Lug-B]